ncbi:MAG: PAS domain S-box protein [Eubacteriales bacterium]
MNRILTTALINNAALLLALSVIYEISYFLPSKYQRSRPVINGLFIAFICVLIMSVPFTLIPGVVFDTRSILISVTALTFGMVPTAITAVLAIILRIVQGGRGAIPGIAAITSSALIGLVWRHYIFPKFKNRRWLSIYIMSVTVHAVMLACMLLIPYPDNFIVIREIAGPVMIIYPIAALLLSLLLLRQQEHKYYQEQLKESEDRFRLLFNKAPLGYQSLDSDGYFLDVNQQWLDLFGYNREEVIGKWFGDFLMPSYIEGFRKRFPVFKAQGQIQSEFEMLCKDGKPLYISFEGKIANGPVGEFKQTHCILQDVTERRKAEDALRESEEKHRRLFETMTQGVIYQAADGKIISANPAAERILGMTIDQMQDRTSMDSAWHSICEDGSVLPGSEHPAMIALQTGNKVGPVVIGIYQPQIKNHVWLSVIATPLFRPGKTNPFQVYTTFNDITSERRANQNYRLLFNKMIDAFALHEIVFDEQGDPADYRYLAVNPTFESFIGKKAEEIIGRTVLEILPDTEKSWIETYGRVAVTGEPAEFTDYSAALGKYFSVSAYRTAPNQFACTFSDITSRVIAEAEAAESLSRLKALLDYSQSPIVIINDKGKFIEVSEAVTRIFNIPREQIFSYAVSQLVPSDMFTIADDFFKQPTNNDKVFEGINAFDVQGKKRYFECRIFPINASDKQDRLFGYIGIDVTERLQAEEALKESEAKYSSYIENAPIGVFVVDNYGQYVDVNHAAVILSGYSREEMLKMNINDITADESINEARQNFMWLKENGSMSAVLQYKHKNGSTRWWNINAVKLSYNHFLGFSSDITDSKKAEDDLVYLIYHDNLTGLYNRKYFEEAKTRLDKAEYLPLTVLIADINGVRLINDSLGYAEGDNLITETSDILTRCCRPEDVLARVGGDEFAMILPNTNSDTAYAVLKKIDDACEFYNQNNKSGFYEISLSVGFGTKENTDEDIADITKIADTYLHNKKLMNSKSFRNNLISSMMATIYEKSQETEEHAKRMTELSKKVGENLNLAQKNLAELELLSVLHDIGKIGIDGSILNKPGRLTDDEWVIMKTHPEVGYRIAKSTSELEAIAEYILAHHERWDGKGYPNGLAGTEIPLLSRIISVVDAYDAMTNDRIYRKAMSPQEAMAQIKLNAGTQFDPQITAVFETIINDPEYNQKSEREIK